MKGSGPSASRRSLSFYELIVLRTNVYIDGFNLYYGALKFTKFKWLNLRSLSNVLFPDDDIQRISYFTARLTPRAYDLAQPERQHIYLRALQTLSDLYIFYGVFRDRKMKLPLASSNPSKPKFVEVIKPEEKGTDVNLATRLLVDGFAGEYDHAVIISNDSDLAMPIRYVKSKLDLKISLVNPSTLPTHGNLVKAATYVRRLHRSHIAQSQFSRVLWDRHGRFEKPATW